MFDEYAEKLKSIGANVPKVFETVAKKAAVHFVNTAKKITNDEKLVDTGTYRRNWNAKQIEVEQNIYGIACSNLVEYASHLEYGHRLRNGKRWQGRFVGRRALDDTHFYCIEQIDDSFEKLYEKHLRGI
jgi:hypothetical protein